MLRQKKRMNRKWQRKQLRNKWEFSVIELPRWKRLDIQINKNIACDLLISLRFGVEKFLFSAKIFRKKIVPFEIFSAY